MKPQSKQFANNRIEFVTQADCKVNKNQTFEGLVCNN